MRLTLMIKAALDASHHGKLALRAVRRKDGHLVHHWMLPPGVRAGADLFHLPPGQSPDDPPLHQGRDKAEALLNAPGMQDALRKVLHLPPGVPFTTDDVIHLCGVPPGATVQFLDLMGYPPNPDPARDRGMYFQVHVRTQNLPMGIEQAQYTVQVHDSPPWKQNPDGSRGATVTLDAMEMVPGHTGTGLGTKMLLAQALEMQRLGFTEIDLSAQRDRPEYANGYYTWPVLGFDAPLPRDRDTLGAMRREFRSLNGGVSLPKITRVQQLLALPHGREVWKKHGCTVRATFSTAPGSPAVARLLAYAQEKGYVQN